MNTLSWHRPVPPHATPDVPAYTSTSISSDERKARVREVEGFHRSKRAVNVQRVAMERDPWTDADQALSDAIAVDDAHQGQNGAPYDPLFDAFAEARLYPGTMSEQQELFDHLREVGQQHLAPPERRRFGSCFRVPQVMPEPQDDSMPDYATESSFISAYTAKRDEANGDSPWRRWSNVRPVGWDVLDTMRSQAQPDRFASDVPLVIAEAFESAHGGFHYTGTAPLEWLHRTLIAKRDLGEPIALLERGHREERAFAKTRTAPPRLVRMVHRVHPDGTVEPAMRYRSRKLKAEPVRGSVSPELPNHLVPRIEKWDPDGSSAPLDSTWVRHTYAHEALDERVALMRTRCQHSRVSRRAWLVFNWRWIGSYVPRHWDPPTITAF